MKSYVLLITVILVFVVFIRMYFFDYVWSVTAFDRSMHTETYDRATGHRSHYKKMQHLSHKCGIFRILRGRWQP